MPAAIATAIAFVAAATATACPFCGPVGRSLAERRDAAARLVVADAVRKAGRADEGLLPQDFAAIVTLRGGELPPGSVVEARVEASVPGTALLFGMDEGPVTRWEAIAADESLIDHVARAPAVEEPVDRRLPRKHRHRYHGVFAPNHKLRRAVTALAIGNIGKQREAANFFPRGIS